MVLNIDDLKLLSIFYLVIHGVTHIMTIHIINYAFNLFSKSKFQRLKLKLTNALLSIDLLCFVYDLVKENKNCCNAC